MIRHGDRGKRGDCQRTEHDEHSHPGKPRRGPEPIMFPIHAFSPFEKVDICAGVAPVAKDRPERPQAGRLHHNNFAAAPRLY